MKKINSYMKISSALLMAGALATSCQKEDNFTPTQPDVDNGERALYNVVLSVDPTTSASTTYVQGRTDLVSGSISFSGYGFEVPSVRTARVYASKSGKTLYNLNYGGGTIAKFAAQGGQNYQLLDETNVKYAIGTEYPRWTKVSEKNALMHNIVSENQYDKDGKYTYTKATAWLVNIGFEGMSIDQKSTIEIPRNEEDDQANLNIWRIDAPVIANGKAYYGVAKRHYDPATDQTNSKVKYQATTLIVDYPSLENPRTISTQHAVGSTYGYRTPVAHLDERGDIYQLTASPSKIVRIKGESYDNDYVFDLSQALGKEVGANGWFYVGEGIGYIPYYDAAKGDNEEVAAWGVARLDLYNKTVVDMNVPDKLWLEQYQSGVIDKEGFFNMAIAPMGGKGHIYRFDPKSSQPDGFKLGSQIETGSNACYLGIF